MGGFIDSDIVKPLTDMVGGLGKTAESIATDKSITHHRIDTTSPFKLPHLIRPISFIWAMANETILTTASIILTFYPNEVNPDAITSIYAALAANTTVLTTMVGFYFRSRKDEKIAFKNAQSNIEMKQMELEADIVKDQFEMQEQKKDNRQERRAEKRAARTRRRNKPTM